MIMHNGPDRPHEGLQSTTAENQKKGLKAAKLNVAELAVHVTGIHCEKTLVDKIIIHQWCPLVKLISENFLLVKITRYTVCT